MASTISFEGDVMNLRILAIAGLFVVCSTAQATDIINQDNKAYKVKEQGEGKLSITYWNIKPRGSQYGACNYSFCTFEIPGSKASATKNGKLFIRGGKFVRP
jgi:hypothetical protein